MDFDGDHDQEARYEALTVAIRKQNSGRNNQGRITTRHRGGGARRFLSEIVNFNLR
jgi:ribosomal protein L2